MLNRHIEVILRKRTRRWKITTYDCAQYIYTLTAHVHSKNVMSMSQCVLRIISNVLRLTKYVLRLYLCSRYYLL